MANALPRFTLRQLMIGVAVVAVMLAGFSIVRALRVGRTYRGFDDIVFSPDGASLSVIGWVGHDAQIHMKHFLKDISRTITLTDTATLSNCSVVHHEFSKEIRGRPRRPEWKAAFGLDGKELHVLIKPDGRIRTWDIAANRWSTNQAINAANIYDFSLSPDGGALAVCREGEAAVWDMPSRQRLLSKADWGWPLAFSPDSKRFGMGTRDGVEIWDLSPRVLVRTFLEGRDVRDRVRCLAFSPDGDTIAVTCHDGFRIYSLTSGNARVNLPEYFEVKRTKGGWGLKGKTGEATDGIAYSPDGKLLVAWGYYGLKFFDCARDYALQKEDVDLRIDCLAFSPDGKTYATCDQQGKLTLWDVATGQELRATFLRANGLAR